MTAHSTSWFSETRRRVAARFNACSVETGSRTDLTLRGSCETLGRAIWQVYSTGGVCARLRAPNVCSSKYRFSRLIGGDV